MIFNGVAENPFCRPLPDDTNRWLVEVDKSSVSKSDSEGDRTVTVTVARTFLGEQTIRLYITGGKSQAEDYGIGKNYTNSGEGYTWVNSDYETSYVALSFGAAEQSKEITLVVEANPVAERNRTLTLSLDNQSTGIVIGGNKTLGIVDDLCTHVTVLPDAYAPTGFSLSELITTYRGTPAVDVVFELGDGIYHLFNKDVVPDPDHGVSIIGNGTGTIIKRPDGIYSRVYYDERMFNTTSYSDAGLSAPVALSNLTLDGNHTTVGWYLSLKKTYTIIHEDWAKYYGIDEASGGEVCTTTFQWLDPAISIPWPDDVVEATTRTYYIEKGATSALSWANLLSKLTTLGFTPYTRDDASYFRIMFDSAQRYVDLTTTQVTTTYGNDSAKLYASCTVYAALLLAGADGDQEGRLSFIIEKIHIQNNNPSGGFSLSANTANRLYYITQTGIFARRSVNVIGGYTTFDMHQCNYEVLGIETTNKGYPGKTNASVVANVTYSTVAQFTTYIYDGNAASLDTVVTANNLTTTESFIWGFHGTLGTSLMNNPSVFTDCNITWGDRPIASDIIGFPHDLVFVRTQFTAKKLHTGDYATGVPQIKFRTSTVPIYNQKVRFQGCEFVFDVAGGVRYDCVANMWSGHFNEGSTVYLEKSGSTLCTARRTDEGLVDAFIGRGTDGRGHNYVITGVDMTNVKYLAYIRLSADPWSLSIDGADCDFEDKEEMVGILDNDTLYDYVTNSKSKARLLMANCELTYAQSTINTTTVWATALQRLDRGKPDFTAGEMRTIINNADPGTSDKGMKFEAAEWHDGTTYKLNQVVKPLAADNGYLYVCTAIGTSEASEPAWETTPGEVTADGADLRWTCYDDESIPGLLVYDKWVNDVSEDEFYCTAEGASTTWGPAAPVAA